jgi:CelD/BcsL family acetyltransferase involved in cellulose biosynthesis
MGGISWGRIGSRSSSVIIHRVREAPILLIPGTCVGAHSRHPPVILMPYVRQRTGRYRTGLEQRIRVEWQLELITQLSALEAIESEWRNLAAARGNVFLTPEWFHTWFRHYGERATPFVLTVRRTDRSLDGVLPLVRIGAGRRRVLRFAGANFGDYFQPVCHENDESRVVDAFARVLRDHRSEWSVAILHNTDVGATWPLQLARSVGRLAPLAGPSVSMPYVALKGVSWERYLEARSANFRSQLRRSTRRLEKRHRAVFRATGDADQLERDMTSFFDLHARRRHARSRLLDPSAQAFHREFASRALQRGWLRLSLLEVDGVAVAALYGVRIGRRYGYYNSGFDPDWSRFSVGFLLLNRTIRDAIDEGAGEYDLMLGGERYKNRFSSTERRVRAFMLAPRLHPVRIAFGLEVGARRAMATLFSEGSASTRRLLRPIARRLPGARG